MSIRGSSIDLGGILTGLMGGNTPTANPAAGATQIPDPDDPSSMIWVDKNGSPLKNQAISQGDTLHAWQDPNLAMKLGNPELAARVAWQNQDPTMAQIAANNQLGIGTERAKIVRPAMNQGSIMNPNVTDQQVSALTGGDPTSVRVSQANQDISDTTSNIPQARTANTGINLANDTLQGLVFGNHGGPSAMGTGLARQANNLATYQSNVVPKQYQFELNQLNKNIPISSADIGNVPAYINRQALDALTAENTAFGASMASSYKADTEENEAKLNAAIAKKKLEEQPTILSTIGHQLRNMLYGEAHPPTSANPFFRTPEGTVARTPDFISSLQKMPATIQGGSINNGITLSSGKTISPITTNTNIARAPSTNSLASPQAPINSNITPSEDPGVKKAREQRQRDMEMQQKLGNIARKAGQYGNAGLHDIITFLRKLSGENVSESK